MMFTSPTDQRHLERAELKLDGRPWISPVWTATPFALTETEGGLEMRASLHQLARRARAQADARVNSLRAPDAAAALPVPPLHLDAPNYDVWAKVGVSGFETETQDTRLGALGADLKLGRRSIVGVSLDMEASELTDASDVARRRVGSYFASRLGPNLSLRGGAYIGEDEVQFGDDSVNAAARDADLNLSWRVPFAQFAVTPSASLAYRGRDFVYDGERTYVSASAVTLAPRLSRSFKTASGTAIEPFVAYEKMFELGDDADVSDTAFTTSQAVSAGFGLKTDEALSVNLSTRVESPADDGSPTLGGRLQFRVPLD